MLLIVHRLPVKKRNGKAKKKHFLVQLEGLVHKYARSDECLLAEE